MTRAHLNHHRSISRRKMIVIGATAILLLTAVYAHVRISGSEDYRGPLALLDRLFDLALVGAIGSTAFCVGRKLSRKLRLSFFSVSEELSFSIMLGTGAIGLAVLGCGLLGLLKPLPIAALILAILAFARGEAGRLFNALNEGLCSTTATRERRLVSFLYGALVILLIVRAATPPWVIDDAIYHLPATKSFVERGQVYPLYDQPLGNMPFLIHMIYALCLLAKTDIAPKLFSLLLALTTSLSLYGFCIRFLHRKTGLVAMFGFFAAAMVVEVATSVRIDVSLAGMLFVTTYAMMIYFEKGEKGWLYASAILGGFSLGIKLTALVWLALLGFMFLIESLVRHRDALKSVGKNGLIHACLMAAVASPWLIKNTIWFQNPLYPFITGEVSEFDSGKIRYFGVEDERKLDSHFDAARKQAPNQVQQIQQSLGEAARATPTRHPFRFWEYYTRPGIYFMGDPRHYPNYLFLIIPLFALFLRSRWLIWLFALSIAFYVFIAWTSWLARFLLPIYPSLTLISAYTLVQLGNLFSPRLRLASRLPVYAVVASMAVPIAVSAHAIVSMRNLSFFAGTVSRREFLSQFSYYPPVDFINRHLPHDARVMTLGAEVCYHMQREYLPDQSWESTEWRRLLVRNESLVDVNAELKRRGVTHILYLNWFFKLVAAVGWPKPGGSAYLTSGNLADPERVQKFGPDYPYLRNWATFDLYRSEFLELIYADEGGYEIYKIK